MANSPGTWKFSHGAIVSDNVDLENNRQNTVAFATALTSTTNLSEGVYDMWADQDCYLLIEVGTAASLTSTTGYLLRATNTVTFVVRENRCITVIMSSATGTLSFMKIQ